MATYTILPSSWDDPYSVVTNPSNAYANTSSSTYANVAGDFAWLGGFDFSTIPSGYSITAISVKVKWRKNSSSSGSSFGVFVGHADGGYEQTDVVLSNEETCSSSSSKTISFTLTASVDTILSEDASLYIRIDADGTNCRVYGAEIIVTAEPRVPNKVIYGNETLIDLTGDTVTTADVASGVTFHLPNGAQATGAATSGLTIVGGEGYPDSSSQFTISNVTHEPVFLYLYTTSTDNMDANYDLQYVVYCQDSLCKWQKYGHSDTVNDFGGTFAYSNNTLTITASYAFKYDTSWPCKYYYYYGY